MVDGDVVYILFVPAMPRCGSRCLSCDVSMPSPHFAVEFAVPIGLGYGADEYHLGDVALAR